MPSSTPSLILLLLTLCLSPLSIYQHLTSDICPLFLSFPFSLTSSNNNNSDLTASTNNNTTTNNNNNSASGRGFSFTQFFSRLVKSVGGGVTHSPTPSSVTLYKVIYSVYPPGKLYQNSNNNNNNNNNNHNKTPLLTGSQKENAGRDVIFTEYHDFGAALKAPAFSDGLKKFFPVQMQSDVPADVGESSCLIIDVRTVTVTPGASTASSSSTTTTGPGAGAGAGTGKDSGNTEDWTRRQSNDPSNHATSVAVAVEPTVPGRSYWTILPLDTKKLQVLMIVVMV